MDLNDLAKNPEQLKSLIAMLQQMLPSEDNPEVTPQEEFIAPLRTRGSKKNIPKNTNKFLSMSEKDMHKDDIIIDQKLSKFPPVSRARDFNMLDVVCRVCGRKETISPALLFDAPDRYKCNNCSTSAG